MMHLDATQHRDLRRACYHELAHLHVARHFGVSGHVTIDRNPDGGLYETHFVGQFHLYGLLRTHARTMVGLAGSIAEFVLDHRLITPEELFQAFDDDPDLLSDSDARFVGQATPQKVAAALWLVRKLWADIVADAELQVTAEARLAGLIEAEVA